MSSSRRNGSVSRAAVAASKNRLHMDRNPQHAKITDPSNPAGRRKEIDNVMKRARQSSPGSWDRKLLQVEEKDPNRWRHTGYKQLYLESGSPRRSRSRSPVVRRSRSPLGRRSRSPLGRRSRSPLGRRSRSPLARRTRSPLGRRERSPLGRWSRSPPGRRSPLRRTSVQRKSRSRSIRRSPRRSPKRSPKRSPPSRRPPAPRRAPPRPRPPSPADPRRSSSGSSDSTCSDESCSVCSGNKKTAPAAANNNKSKPPAAPSASSSKRAAAAGAAPTRELMKAREASKRSREEKVLEWQRSQLGVRAAPPLHPAQIKREGERRTAGGAGAGGVSVAVVAAALTRSSSEEESEASADAAPQRLTLSERFGKMAQWSAARGARVQNMRITRRAPGAGLHVHIEPAPAPGPDGAAEGAYPEELAAAAPGGLLSWDDVRVRYDYYKQRGYLRGLTLADYVKWEEWWYKYQEWLKRERAYERWAEQDAAPPRRERRRRGGRHRRS
ncbi:serine/arginine repetitive matrix protein 1 isoform X2 [Leptidea sinapis]|uniref:serine/arginine repetitive matrix protein 1 isoform X2 n=1 Tax=Leptidea sinapis TaxID=189913 RepID=UPI00212DEE8E|nr:serine/arginine repetitive matrix protein 1 isoform X2 [Leptidea sinapis]XP_050676397.1 serine/arginine repetitive matrix protein 1 isoform X2 [Leptidea sinapis]